MGLNPPAPEAQHDATQGKDEPPRESRPLTRQESLSLNSGVQFSALLGSDSSVIWKKSRICWGEMCLCFLVLPYKCK